MTYLIVNIFSFLVECSNERASYLCVFNPIKYGLRNGFNLQAVFPLVRRMTFFFFIWCCNKQYKTEYNWEVHTNNFGYKRQKRKKNNWLKTQNPSCPYHSFLNFFQWLPLALRMEAKLLTWTTSLGMSCSFLSLHPHLAPLSFTLSIVVFCWSNILLCPFPPQEFSSCHFFFQESPPFLR